MAKYLNKFLSFCDSMKKIRVVLLLITVMFFIYYTQSVYRVAPYFFGEYPSAIFPVYSIVYEHSFHITSKSIDLIKKDMSVHPGIETRSLVRSRNGGGYGFYTPLYSLACIPIFFIQKISNGTVGYFPALTNLILLLIAVVFIIFRLKASKIQVVSLTLLTLISPIIYYLKWMSSEVYIYSLLAISLVFLFNKEYKKSIFLMSLTACSQPTLYAFAGGIFLIYLYDIYDKNRGLILTIKDNLKNIIFTALCFSPILLSFGYAYIATGKFQLSTVQGVTSFGGFFSRFVAYFIDLNFGFLPYIPLILIVSAILFIGAIVKKQIDMVIYFICFLIFVAGYSLMPHINCGQDGMHRYTAFSLPAILFFFVMYFNKIFSFKGSAIVLGSIVAVSLVINLIFMAGNYNRNFIFLQPVAKLAFNNFPGLYNPLFSTFNSRINHLDGGYDLPPYVIYSDERTGMVRKILINPSLSDMQVLANSFKGDDKGLAYMRDELERIKGSKEYGYINIPKKYGIVFEKSSD